MDYSVIIFLSILAAGAAVLIGFATIRFYATREGDDREASLPFAEPTQSQAVYMREVRARNQYDIARLTGQAQYSYGAPATATASRSETPGGSQAWH